MSNTTTNSAGASRRGFLLGAAAAAAGLAGMGGRTWAQQNPPNAARAVGAPTALEIVDLDADLKVILWGGGNIAVHTSPETILVVDAGLPDRAKDVVAAITKIAGAPAGKQKVLFNTHYHFDHIGANELLADEGYVIVGSDQCRKRNSERLTFEALGMTLEPLPVKARQSVTFGEAGMKLHVPDEVRLVKIQPSHTDTDAVAVFTEHNVLHTGDLFFKNGFPVVDRGTGGSLDGMIAATKTLIGMVNAETRIIPGHGTMATVEDLRKTLAMLEEVQAIFAPYVKKKTPMAEVIAAKPLAALEDTWGRGFVRGEMFIRMAYPR
jgi:glyoxylase-like metal-dependent hydrolase (beta-lactamase superfamily II)